MAVCLGLLSVWFLYLMQLLTSNLCLQVAEGYAKRSDYWLQLQYTLLLSVL